MKLSTADIRRICLAREDGKCACGCGRFIDTELSQMDHTRGRVRAPQSVENCWMLHPDCHTRRTNNDPSGITWWALVLAHARKHAYDAEAEHAEARIQMLQAKRLSYDRAR